MGALAALPALGFAARHSPALAASSSAAPPRPQNVLTPEEAVERLLAGNRRYRNNLSERRDFHLSREALARGQNPYASILSCADSRVSPELCFDESTGDLFVNRVAGNYVTADLLASLEYGAAVLGAPVILVLGHTQCGAVGAAIDAVQHNTDFPGHIQNITTALAPAVHDALDGNSGSSPMAAPQLADAVTRANVRRNVALLERATPILRQRVKAGTLKVVGGVYHLDTGEVELF